MTYPFFIYYFGVQIVLFELKEFLNIFKNISLSGKKVIAIGPIKYAYIPIQSRALNYDLPYSQGTFWVNAF